MKKNFLYISLLTVGALTLSTLSAAEESLGFVNFKKCVEHSKAGQQEKNSFEAMKKQMTEVLEKSDKELSDIAKKLEDQEYMDGLSPTAEEELKQKFQVLSQEMSRYQTQYYQLLNQANYRMLQTLHDKVSSAAETVREKNHLALIISEDSTFAYAPTLDFTQEVIKALDGAFEAEKGAKENG